MKEWLDDIRTEIQTLKACVCRLSEQVDELEHKLEEDFEKRSVPISVAETSAPVSSVLSARMNDRVKSARSLRHAFSLNDSFRFTRELFEGDVARMNRLLDALSEAGTLESAIKILENEVSLSEDNEAMADFIDILRKYFS